MQRYFYVGIGFLAVGALVAILRLFLSPWLKGRLSGYPIAIAELVYAVARGAKTALISDAYIVARKAGVVVPMRELTNLYRTSPHTFTDEVRRLIERSGRR